MTQSPVRGRAGLTASRRGPMAAAERAAAKRATRAAVPESARAPEPAPEVTLEPAPEVTLAPVRRRGHLRTVLTAAALLAGLAAVTVLGLQYHDAERTDKARIAALAAAQTAAPVIFSYDYRHLDADFASASGYLTGAFRDQYAKTTETVVKPTAQQYQGVVQATVARPPAGGDPAAAVVSAAPDKVVVLLFMNQVTTSTRISGPHLDLNRVRMTMVHTAQGWKVSAVDAL